MPATSEPVDGARPARGPIALLGGAEAGPLTRVRCALLVLALAGCVFATLAVAGVPDRTAGLRLAGAAAVAALALVWLRALRHEALSPWDEPIELLALFAVGLAAGPTPALAVIYPGLYFRSLFGSRLRAATGLAVYGAAYVAAVVADGGDAVAEGFEHVLALGIGCAVVHAFAAVLARHERSLRREQILRRASAALADARDRAAVYAATLGAVERLGDGRPGASVIALLPSDGRRNLTIRAAVGPWLPGVEGSPVAAAELSSDVADVLWEGRACAIASPRQAGLELCTPTDLDGLDGVCLPLVVRGEPLGFLAVFGPALASAEDTGVLAALAAESALALAAAGAADSAADDRSIQRLTRDRNRE